MNDSNTNRKRLLDRFSIEKNLDILRDEFVKLGYKNNLKCFDIDAYPFEKDEYEIALNKRKLIIDAINLSDDIEVDKIQLYVPKVLQDHRDCKSNT